MLVFRQLFDPTSSTYTYLLGDSVSGEAVLIEDDGRTPMRPGDIAVWPKGSTNGHHLVNESDADCVFVALGGGKKYDTGGGYSDIDMLFTPDGYTRKDGTPYPVKRLP